MSDPVTNVEIEDVLSSIRRLVAQDLRPVADIPGTRADADSAPAERLVLTPSLRVSETPENPQAGSNQADWDDDDALQPEDAGDAAAGIGLFDDGPGDGGEADTGEDHDAPVDHSAPDTLVFHHAEPEAHPAPGEMLATDAGAPGMTAPEPMVEDMPENAESLPEQEPEQTRDEAALDATWIAPQAQVDPAPDAETVTEPEPAADIASEEDTDTEEEPATPTYDLAARIAELEAAISKNADAEWEPDGGDQEFGAGLREVVDWEDVEPDLAPETGPAEDVRRADEAHAASVSADDIPAEYAPDDYDHVETDSAPHVDAVETPTEASAGYTDADTDIETEGSDVDLLANDEAVIDEEALRDLVADIVRQELQGTLGERITRNVRKLVRREIHRALTTQDLD